MADRFTDERGVIQDLVGEVDSITEIFTVAGAVRGNHVHRLTTQWTYVVSGNLLIVDGATNIVVGPSLMVEHKPGTPHAWKALEDTVCLVFTKGPRSGEGYESDTYRLDDPLLS
jgi:quercetin dioxygenase-like cupin family protein